MSENIFPDNYPEILSDIAIAAKQALDKKKIDNSEQLSFDIAESIRHYLGGIVIYLPRGDHLEINKRQTEIYNKFNGKNTKALALEYGCCEQHIYRIVRAKKREERAKKQTDLFGVTA